MPAQSPPDADDDARRAHIRSTVLAQVSTTPERRREALREFLGVTRPDLGGDAAMALAADIPPLWPGLHEKWADMFAARLLETVPAEQVALLCDGTAEHAAALVLAYLMFLESERMERQIAADLAAFRREHPEMATTGRNLISTVLGTAESARRDKATAYGKAKKARPN